MRPSWVSFPISSNRSMRCSRSRRGSPCGPTGRSLPSCVSWPSCASALPTAAASPVSSTVLRRRSIPTAPSCAIRPSVHAAISRPGSSISASDGSAPSSRRASEGILPSLYQASDGLLPSLCRNSAGSLPGSRRSVPQGGGTLLPQARHDPGVYSSPRTIT